MAAAPAVRGPATSRPPSWSATGSHRPRRVAPGRRAGAVRRGSRPRPDVLLVERASTLRDHAGQVAFPGGGDRRRRCRRGGHRPAGGRGGGGVEPSGVVPLALLPDLFVPPSGFVVTPVLAHWARPVAVHAVDPGETASVVRVPVAALADPAHRLRVRHPSGFTGPAFVVRGVARVGLHRGPIVRAVGSGRMGASVGHHSGDGPRRSVVGGPGRSAGGRRIVKAGAGAT